MNPGEYQRRSQMHDLPMDFQYDGSQVASSQPADGMPSFDGLPRTPSEQQLLSSWPPTMNNYNFTSPMQTAQASAEWANPTYASTDFDDTPLTNDYSYYSHYSSTFPGAHQNDAFSRGLTLDGVPRTWQLSHDSRLPSDGMADLKAYEPSIYMIEQSREEPADFAVMRPDLVYDRHDSSRDFPRSISGSPKIEKEAICNDLLGFGRAARSKMQMSEASDDSGNSSREMTAVDFEDHGADEPYAKLIYRALMSAPNHSMVLQEIYQWFRDNTAKGSSDTKGWMNSIRHNLSMNAAFKKTERKVPGDETKKSTEWVLEDFAIKDGVQSTTRYRKGTGSKKFTKSDNPAPARQTSGRKGGISAGKTKSQRSKVRDDRPDIRLSGLELDTGRHAQFHHDVRAEVIQRHISPLTPPNLESISPSPYYFPKNEQFELPYEDMCGLEVVQGVYIDENEPLFTSPPNPHFTNTHPMGANRY